MKTFLTLGLAALTFSAFAQTPPPPPAGGPPPRGPAGPGPAHDLRPPMGDGMGWILENRVRLELHLTAQQTKKIRALGPNRGADRPGMPGMAPPPPNGRPPVGGPPAGDPIASPPARGLGPDEPKNGELTEAQLQKILDRGQFARFRQLRLQREGERAIARPEIAKRLGISDKQIERMRPGPPPDRGAPRPPKIVRRPDPKGEEGRILMLLTKAQRAKWRAMTGKPFDFGTDRPRLGQAPPVPPLDRENGPVPS